MGQLAVIFENNPLPGLETTIRACVYTTGMEVQRCTIVHYKREGACLSASAELPNMFIMRPVDSPIERICRIVWRDEHLLGVQYVNARSIGRRKRELPADTSAITTFPAA